MKAKLRSWGNSIGVVLPKELVESEGLNINDEVEITIKKTNSTLKEAFGAGKKFNPITNKSNDELWTDLDKELDPKD